MSIEKLSELARLLNPEQAGEHNGNDPEVLTFRPRVGLGPNRGPDTIWTLAAPVPVSI
jgi:hypothetical protein